MNPASQQPNASSHISLQDLPPELLAGIASHSAPEELVAFSNSSTVLRDVCLSQRYETVSLGWAVGTRYDDAGDIEVDQDSLLKQQKVVREMLEDLAADEGKLACVRTLRVLEYSWYGEREMQLLEKIVRGATGLGTVQMALNSDTMRLTYVEFIALVWSAIQSAPLLHTFIGQEGPTLPLEFDRFLGPLTRIDIAGYALDEDDGGLPTGVTKLTLTYVDTHDGWIRPELFNSLEMLLLRNAEEKLLEQIVTALEGFTATGRPSALTTLSLHLFPEGMDFLPHNFDLLKRLLSSFTPASFPHLTQIEILSTPGTDSFALRARSLAEELVDWFPVMEDLTLFLGVGTSLLSLRYSAESLETFAEALNGATHLKSLTMNILNMGTPSPSQALIFFQEIPSLKHLSIRAAGPLLHGGAGYLAVRDGGGEVSGVVEDGVRMLVGEEEPVEMEGFVVQDDDDDEA